MAAVRVVVQRPREKPETFEFTRFPVRIGRRPDNEIVLAEEYVSQRHVLIREEAGRVELCDLGSRNGTFRDNERISSEDPLPVGGRLTVMIGAIELVLEEIAPPPASAGERRPAVAEDRTVHDVMPSFVAGVIETAPPPPPAGEVPAATVPPPQDPVAVPRPSFHPPTLFGADGEGARSRARLPTPIFRPPTVFSAGEPRPPTLFGGAPEEPSGAEPVRPPPLAPAAGRTEPPIPAARAEVVPPRPAPPPERGAPPVLPTRQAESAPESRLSGPSGQAVSGPSGQSVSGPSGQAVSEPSGQAVSGPSEQGGRRSASLSAATSHAGGLAAPDERRASALLESLCEGIIGLRRGLDEAGQELGVRPFSGRSPLHTARDSRELARHLLDPGADMESRRREIALLFAEMGRHHLAMMAGLMEGARALLTRLDPAGFDIEKGPRFMPILDREQWQRFTALFHAIQESEQELHDVLFGAEFAEGYASASGDRDPRARR